MIKPAQPNIRTATAADAPTLARIYVDSWNQGFQSLMPSRECTSDLVRRWEIDLSAPFPKRWWAAELDGVVAGFAGIGPSRDPVDPSLGELDTIAVDPAYWRHGVGRALMKVALQFLKSDGYREGVLWTLANYERGQRFYEAMGWELTDAMRDHGRQVQYQYVWKS
jgi:GNAT superfamily N-acetyltransferase